MKIPTEKEATKEYIQHVRKMKEVYRLEPDNEELANQKANSIMDAITQRWRTKKKE